MRTTLLRKFGDYTARVVILHGDGHTRWRSATVVQLSEHGQVFFGPLPRSMNGHVAEHPCFELGGDPIIGLGYIVIINEGEIATRSQEVVAAEHRGFLLSVGREVASETVGENATAIQSEEIEDTIVWRARRIEIKGRELEEREVEAWVDDLDIAAPTYLPLGPWQSKLLTSVGDETKAHGSR